MILSELARYLAQHRRATLSDLSLHFDASPEALRGMLAALERKGRVRRVTGATVCRSGCCQCDPATLERYEWLAATPDADN